MILGLVVFLGAHTLTTQRELRARLIGSMGEGGYKAGYAVVSLVGLALIEKSLLPLPPQLGNLNDPMRVFQLKAPLEGMYSLVYQKVQPSAGSIVMAL
jgi:hypothetical protein